MPSKTYSVEIAGHRTVSMRGEEDEQKTMNLAAELYTGEEVIHLAETALTLLLPDYYDAKIRIDISVEYDATPKRPPRQPDARD